MYTNVRIHTVVYETFLMTFFSFSMKNENSSLFNFYSKLPNLKELKTESKDKNKRYVILYQRLACEYYIDVGKQ